MNDTKVIVIATAMGVAVAAIGIVLIRNDGPATGAADRAVVTGSMTPSGTSIPSAMPRKPVELAPAATGTAAGDGVWAVGREIARGTYRTDGGRSCHWARLTGAPGAPWSLDTAPTAQLGPQVIVLGNGDVAFATGGCAPWRRIR